MKAAKRILAFVTSLTIVTSNISPVFAGKFESEYGDINKDKRYPLVDDRIINKLPNDEIYDLKEGESITNPDEPNVYTYRWSYKRPVNGEISNSDKMELANQPYVASVGSNANDEEKAKVKYKLKPPILKGYKNPEEEYEVSYDFIKNNANEGEGLLHNSTRDINYVPTTNNGIKVKHLFQSLKDKDLYENLEGEKEIITIQKNVSGDYPRTGQRLKLDNLFNPKIEKPIGYSDSDFLNLKEKIKGFEPERNADKLEIIVPEVTNNTFVIHYNRKTFQVKINTDGGSYIPDMTLFYGQTIPSITEIPKKSGASFDHWEANKDICIKEKSGEESIIKANTPIDMTKYQDGFQNAMPAEDITFKAIYNENKMADYSVEFWVEKADYDDKNSNLPLNEKYEFAGNRVLNGPSGTTPDLSNISIAGIAFPDLDKTRLNKIYTDKDEFDKYFKYNKALSDSQNQDISNELEENESGNSRYKKVARTIDASGNTSYKLYFDRQVYTLYFSKLISEVDSEHHFWPTITKDGNVYESKLGKPYRFKARFNQSLQGLWPDPIDEVKGYSEGNFSLGWAALCKDKKFVYRDTPPYRLTADDFIDPSDIKNNGGYSNALPLGDGGESKLGPREMGFGMDSNQRSMPYQVEFIMDTYPGFEVDGKPVEKIHDFSLKYRKFDTESDDYEFTLPAIEGFEPKYKKTKAKERYDYYDWDDINEERVEEFKTYLKFIGAPRKDVENYKNIFKEKYKYKFMGSYTDEDGNDQLENPDWENFDANCRIELEYSRKSYTINFNNDPRMVRDDTSYEDFEKKSVPYQHPLRWLDGVYNFDYNKSDEENKEAREKFDQAHIIDNRKPEKPKWVPESWKFLGWSLNPEGTNLVKDGNYTMPAHNITLYAKWGCDTDSKVTFDLGLDADEATEYMIKPTDLKSNKFEVGDDVRTSIKEYKKYKLPTEDTTSTPGKQVFIVGNGLPIKSPAIPKRAGYDFMGWEHIVYKKDDEGNITSEVDDSFKKKYGPSRQYTFESEVYSDVYLKAIWAKNNLYDVKITDHILDENLNEVKTETNILGNQREGIFAFYFARLQGENLTLVPDKELEQAPEKVREAFIQYRNKIKEESDIATNRSSDSGSEINTYYQNVKVDTVKCPMAYNQLQFFYKPYRKREYKVNYLLVANNANLSDTTKYPSVGKPDPNITKPIIDQDEISNGNRHYDARNFRPIPGFKLVSKPQVQLMFEVNEENNKLLKINGVEVGDNLDNAQVNFYYKDVRVIKNKQDNPPVGYHRISFVAKDHGSFGKDETGKKIKEVHCDVIDGLYFAKVHVPTKKSGSDKKELHLIADPGYEIGRWSQKDSSESGLLDPNTIITKDYTFEIDFPARKYPEIEPIKVFESAKDGNKYINNFLPNNDDYDKALSKFKQVPDYKSYEIVDDDEAIYDRLKEDGSPVGDSTPKDLKIKANLSLENDDKVMVDLPIKLYKNIYTAQNNGDKPYIVKNDDFLSDFVKVSLVPTNLAKESQEKVYYVNPKAKVCIPTDDPIAENSEYSFAKWYYLNDQNEKVEIKLSERNKFTKEIKIFASYSRRMGEITPLKPRVKPIIKKLGDSLTDVDYKKAIIPPQGKEVDSVQILEQDSDKRVSTKEAGSFKEKVKVRYKDNSSYTVDVPVIVSADYVEKPDDSIQKPDDKPDDKVEPSDEPDDKVEVKPSDESDDKVEVKPSDRTDDKLGNDPKDKDNSINKDNSNNKVYPKDEAINPNQKILDDRQISEVQEQIDQNVKKVTSTAGKIAGNVSTTLSKGVARTKKAVSRVLNPHTGIISDYEIYLGLMAASSVGLFFTKEKKNKDEE